LVIAIISSAGRNLVRVRTTDPAKLTVVLEKSKAVRRATNGLSHVVVTPAIAPISDLSHGQVLKAGRDLLLIPGKINYNIGHTALDTVTHPGKILDAGGDVVSDGKSVLNYLDDKIPISPKNLSKSLTSLAHLGG